MGTKEELLHALLSSTESRACRAMPACDGKTFVHDMRSPGNLDRKARAPIMVVGEAPGNKENQLGWPFSGPTSDKIDSSLRQAGLSRNDVYFSNPFKCHPTTRNETGQLVNRTPTPGELLACAPLLEKEIEIVDPHVIVAMGATAIRSLTGETGVKSAIDRKVLWHGSIPVIPTYHPSSSTHFIKAGNVNEAMRIRELREEAFRRAALLVKKT